MLFFNRQNKKCTRTRTSSTRKKHTNHTNSSRFSLQTLLSIFTLVGLLLGSLSQWDKVVAILDEIGQTIFNDNTLPNTPPPANKPTLPPTPTPATPAPTLKIYSWNIANFGESKDSKEITFIANQLKDADIVAIQEVSVLGAGAMAVAQLADELNRKGANWNYALSQPTSGEGSERYAFLWKSAKIALSGNVWNTDAQGLADKIDREPCLAKFKIGERNFTVANFHAVPVTKNPAQEIAYLELLHNIYRKENLIIAGDFNLSEKDKAFEGLKNKKYSPVLKNQRTSLRKTIEPNGNYLSQEYDNIFIENTPFVMLRSGIIDFVPKTQNLLQANEISDHLPVWCEIKLL